MGLTIYPLSIRLDTVDKISTTKERYITKERGKEMDKLVYVENVGNVEIEQYQPATQIWFKGSRFYKMRAIYINKVRTHGTKYIIKWGGSYIEIVRGCNEWVTVEQY